MASGFKVVKLCTSEQNWEAWTAKSLYGLVELEIPADATVIVPESYSCSQASPYYFERRSNKAVVKRILHLDGSEVADLFGRSDNTWAFTYKKGDTVAMGEAEGTVEFSDVSKSCVPGIHYFQTVEQAQKLATFWQSIHA
eukprot:TRINITY_DN814_c0_g1_i1.p1 TRINITY_DN814_c0_g1~~TRINITY_DN814_c0_g1_i1.p1  ORF type:complete len:140 (+),score=23.56 TRINITY_DN814_c0_g1_i1:51-470(+)